MMPGKRLTMRRWGDDVFNDITSRWLSMENLTQQLNNSDGCFLVAENPAGSIVGHAGTVHLTSVVEWAGPGTTIDLEFESENTAAIGFYRKHGFVADGQPVQCGGEPVAGQAFVMKRTFS